MGCRFKAPLQFLSAKNLHFLSTEFPFLSREFQFSDGRISFFSGRRISISERGILRVGFIATATYANAATPTRTLFDYRIYAQLHPKFYKHT